MADPLAPYIAKDNQDAAHRYGRWKEQDPFPSIPPALLNSADVRDYVAAVGILCPFHDDPDCLKPASYEVALLGDYVYWDQEVRLAGTITTGDEFVLKPNSIAFVTLEPLIRLPSYLAIRFNLKITNVYRGLLLGTGPLVDPGFVGRLSLPLHNLTTNSYTFVGGEGLIWMEFTKLSPDRLAPSLGADAYPRLGKVVPLPDEKRRMSGVGDYLRKAYPHGQISSSIPIAIEAAKTAAIEAGERAESVQNSAQRTIGRLRGYGLVGVIVTVVAVVTIVVAVFALVNDVNDRIDGLPSDPTERVAELTRELELLKQRIAELEASSSDPP